MYKKQYSRILSMYKSGLSSEVCFNAMVQYILGGLNMASTPDDDVVALSQSDLLSELSKWVPQFYRDIAALRSHD